MKTSIKVSGVTLLVSALIIPSFALAAEIRTGQTTTLASTETTKGNIYLFGGTVSSDGAVAGDLVAGGGTVVVSGAVAKDLAIGGGNVTVIANIGDDVRAGGGTMLLNGTVGGDVVAGGGSLQINGAGVAGDVLWGGGTLTLNAPVGGSLQVMGGEVTINSHVRGNVEFKGDKLTLGKNALIDGNLTYSAKAEATMEVGASVKGKTTFEQIKASTSTNERTAAGLLAIFSVFVLGKFLAMLLLAFAIGLFFNRYTLTVVRNGLAQPLQEMGRGVIAVIVLPIVSVIALITLVGIPFGILGLLAFVMLLIVASALAAITAGSLVHKWIYKPSDYLVTWKTILLGVVVVTILGFIPLLGAIAKSLLFVLALGAMIKIKWGAVKEWR